LASVGGSPPPESTAPVKSTPSSLAATAIRSDKLTPLLTWHDPSSRRVSSIQRTMISARSSGTRSGDGTGTPVVERGAVLVKDGRIAEVTISDRTLTGRLTAPDANSYVESGTNTYTLCRLL